MLLSDQDRSLWDRDQIDRGRTALDRAPAMHGHGRYVVQAAIASLHLERDRDWAQIAALYGQLVLVDRSPVVALNRAIAVGEAHGPAAGLELLDALDLPD